MGSGFTVIVTVAVLLQPEPLMPVTVYVDVVVGVTEVLAQVGQATPVVGSQEYEVAPEAEIVADDPKQTALPGLVVITGKGLTETVIVPVPTHPAALVPEMV